MIDFIIFTHHIFENLKNAKSNYETIWTSWHSCSYDFPTLSSFIHMYLSSLLLEIQSIHSIAFNMVSNNMHFVHDNMLFIHKFI